MINSLKLQFNIYENINSAIVYNTNQSEKTHNPNYVVGKKQKYLHENIINIFNLVINKFKLIITYS